MKRRQPLSRPRRAPFLVTPTKKKNPGREACPPPLPLRGVEGGARGELPITNQETPQKTGGEGNQRRRRGGPPNPQKAAPKVTPPYGGTLRERGGGAPGKGTARPALGGWGGTSWPGGRKLAEGCAIGRVRTARSDAVRVLVRALPVVVAATKCGACCLSLVGPRICWRVGGTRDIPVEALFPQGRERFELGFLRLVAGLGD